MINIIIFFLTILVIIGIAVAIDWYFIEVKKYLLQSPYKYTRNCIVGFLFSLNCYHFDIDYDTISYFAAMAIQTSLFWFLFDLFLNISRGKDLFYNGKNSYLDRYLFIYSDPVEITIKFLFIIFSFYFFIKYCF